VNWSDAISLSSPDLSLNDDLSAREITYRKTNRESKHQLGTDVHKRLREEETILRAQVVQLTNDSERVAADPKTDSGRR
jgi:hypothetical protein